MKEVIDLVAQSIEVLAVLIIVGGILYGMGSYLFHHRQTTGDTYKQFKEKIGKSLLLGLEFLIAADIIKTVTFDLTLPGVLLLGALVLIRTFLSWSLLVEIEGHWPWQARGEPIDRSGDLPVERTQATD
ncbi:MAG: DUF1622 domain-containing protein [Syntrophobacteraceae bacterium]|nr:DUF1622 domain-containing protein [Syntrophobacteraceae bacterium]